MEVIPRSHRSLKPDWSADQEGYSYRCYQSQTWLGRLYREVQLPIPPSLPPVDNLHETPLELNAIVTFLRRTVFVSTDVIESLVYDRVSSFIQPAPVLNQRCIRYVWELFYSYTQELLSVCMRFTMIQRRIVMLTEEEVVAGTIVGNTSQPHGHKERMSQLREQATELVSRITDELRSPDENETLKRAWIGLRLSSMRPSSFGSQSFRLIVLHEIFDALNTIKSVVASD